jgi:hypothetical protein
MNLEIAFITFLSDNKLLFHGFPPKSIRAIKQSVKYWSLMPRNIEENGDDCVFELDGSAWSGVSEASLLGCKIVIRTIKVLHRNGWNFHDVLNISTGDKTSKSTIFFKKTIEMPFRDYDVFGISLIDQNTIRLSCIKQKHLDPIKMILKKLMFEIEMNISPNGVCEFVIPACSWSTINVKQVYKAKNLILNILAQLSRSNMHLLGAVNLGLGRIFDDLQKRHLLKQNLFSGTVISDTILISNHSIQDEHKEKSLKYCIGTLGYFNNLKLYDVSRDLIEKLNADSDLAFEERQLYLNECRITNDPNLYLEKIITNMLKTFYREGWVYQTSFNMSIYHVIYDMM